MHGSSHCFLMSAAPLDGNCFDPGVVPLSFFRIVRHEGGGDLLRARLAEHGVEPVESLQPPPLPNDRLYALPKQFRDRCAETG